MAVGQNRLVVAGPPDLLDPQDPLGAFEGRKGGMLRVLSAGTGKELAGLELDSPPVFNGIAAATSRLFVSLQGGSMVSIGEKPKSAP